MRSQDFQSGFESGIYDVTHALTKKAFIGGLRNAAKFTGRVLGVGASVGKAGVVGGAKLASTTSKLGLKVGGAGLKSGAKLVGKAGSAAYSNPKKTAGGALSMAPTLGLGGSAPKSASSAATGLSKFN
jgi:hypothetical protein